MIKILKLINPKSANLKNNQTKPIKNKQSANNPVIGNQQGARAEQLARRFLEYHGIRILQTNYRCKVGEIDLIAKQKSQLIFIEVRYRKYSDYGSPAASVTLRKQQKVIAAGLSYLGQSPQFSPQSTRYRFDVIQVQPISRQDTERPVHSSKRDIATSNTPIQNHTVLFEGHKIAWIMNAFTR